MQAPIQHKRSSEAAKVPAIGDLVLGELAINTFDGKVYLKKNDGTETIQRLLSDFDIGAAVQTFMQAATQAEMEAGAETALRAMSPLLISQAIAALVPDATPPGAVQPFAMSTAPSGWLKANGAALSRTVYANLFSAIGTSFGVGNGSTTFNLPDLRGEFVRGWDDARGVDGGRGFASKQAARTGSAGLQDFMEIRMPYAYGTKSMHVFAPKRGVHPNYGGATNGYRNTLVTSDIGETRPRNVAMLYCIKY